MTTDISVSSSSLYNFETDSSSSYVSSSLTSHSYALQPRQTRNLESLLTILGLLRKLQGAYGTSEWANGLSEDADHRSHPFYDPMNGTRDKKAKSEGYDAL